MSLDTSNKFFVAVTKEDHISILNHQALSPLTPDDALVLAAWLVALAQTFLPSETFETILEKVENG